MKIQIKECYGDYVETTSSHRADDKHEAIERAIQKRYGRNAVWHEDRGLRSENDQVRYGQAFRPGDSAMSSITGRLAVKVV